MILSLIAAVAENGIIGCAGRMPWHLSADLKRFKHITSGHPVVMGRKTFESLGGKPLPGRLNIVVTRNSNLTLPEGVLLVPSLEAVATSLANSDNEEVFIIGGGEIYQQAMPMANKLYLTRIAAAPEGDTYFPAIDDNQWRLVWHETHPAEGEAPAFEFADYIRIKENK